MPEKQRNIPTETSTIEEVCEKCRRAERNAHMTPQTIRMYEIIPANPAALFSETVFMRISSVLSPISSSGILSPLKNSARVIPSSSQRGL